MGSRPSKITFGRFHALIKQRLGWFPPSLAAGRHPSPPKHSAQQRRVEAFRRGQAPLHFCHRDLVLGGGAEKGQAARHRAEDLVGVHHAAEERVLVDGDGGDGVGVRLGEGHGACRVGRGGEAKGMESRVSARRPTGLAAANNLRRRLARKGKGRRGGAGSVGGGGESEAAGEEDWKVAGRRRKACHGGASSGSVLSAQGR